MNQRTDAEQPSTHEDMLKNEQSLAPPNIVPDASSDKEAIPNYISINISTRRQDKNYI